MNLHLKGSKASMSLSHHVLIAIDSVTPYPGFQQENARQALVSQVALCRNSAEECAA